MSDAANQDFRIAALRDAAGGDEALVAELLTIFLRTLPGAADRFARALAAGHAAQVAQEAHDLKACLVLVGATAAGAEFAHIETAARRTGACPSLADGARLRARLATIAKQAECHRAAAAPLS